jgi:hypothetical protein
MTYLQGATVQPAVCNLSSNLSKSYTNPHFYEKPDHMASTVQAT